MALVRAHMAEWKLVHAVRARKPVAKTIQKWEPPAEGWIKVNSDGAVSKHGGSGGGGAVLRDHNVAFLAGSCHHLPHTADPEAAEVLAYRRDVQLAIERDVQRLHLELDSSTVVQMIKLEAKNMSTVGPWPPTLCTRYNGDTGTPSSHLPPRPTAARLGHRCVVQVVRHHQQLRVHGVAGDPLQRGLSGDGQHRLRAGPGGVEDHGGARGVVGASLGPDALLHGPRRQVRVRDRRLRLRAAGLRGRRGRAARHAGGVHDGRQRRHGLLRREPGGRVQPADAGGAGAAGRGCGGGGGNGRQLRADGVRGGPERRVPGRPTRVVDGGRGRRGVQERVRGVRDGAVLLQRRVRQPRHVPAVGLLAVLQERVPARLQLRLRRRHLHLHLRRRRLRLRHHLLPQHHQREVGRVEPAGAGGPAADQRHDGVPVGRPVRRRGRGRAAVAGPRRRPRRRGGARARAPHAAVIDHSAVPPAAGHAMR